MGQLAAAKASASNLGTEADRAKARIEHLKKEVGEKEPKAKKAEKEGGSLVRELEEARKEKSRLEGSLGKESWSEEMQNALRDRKDGEEKAVRKLLEVCFLLPLLGELRSERNSLTLTVWEHFRKRTRLNLDWRH